jgi:beta-glucosidase-like glycosyl hydrolase
MDIRQKAARLFWVGYSDRPGDDPRGERKRLKRDIARLGAGGFCIFGGDVGSIPGLVEEMRRAASHPLFVASDLERGLGQQLRGGTVLPSQMAIAAGGRPSVAFAAGWATAVEARGVGIDVIFSPVADVASEPCNPIVGVRSFGARASTVSEFTTAFVGGCEAGGAVATVKHFPGHGHTRLDSHIELPIVDADREVLIRRELAPFISAIRSGARAIMTAHVAYPALAASGEPATFSSEILTDLLRGELSFEGVVVTDALLMGAIAGRSDPGEAAVCALEAGADVLLLPADFEKALKAVLGAVRVGRLTEERIDASIARLDTLGTWLGARGEAELPETSLAPDVAASIAAGPPEEQEGGRTRFEALADVIAGHAVTFADGLVPVPIDPAAAGSGRATFVALADERAAEAAAPFAGRLAEIAGGATVIAIDGGAPESERAALVSEAASGERVVLLVFDEIAAWRGRPGPSDEIVAVGRDLTARCENVTLVAFASPFVLSLFPEARTLISCYDGSPAMQRAAVDALFRRAPMRGSLPAPVPSAHAPDTARTEG